MNIKDIAKKLNKARQTNYHLDDNHSLGLSGRQEIYAALDIMLGILFPGRYLSKCNINRLTNKKVAKEIAKVRKILLRHVEEVICDKIPCQKEANKNRAIECVDYLIEELAVIREELIEDINVAYHGDPAAQSIDEVMLSYPYIEAIATHRIAHRLYKMDVRIIPRIMSEKAHSLTGIDIHPGANIAAGFFIDHGTGVVIGETCNIGKNVIIYQGVTLGALSPYDKEGNPQRGVKRHPDIEDDTIIYANSTILGGNTTIGKGSVIGGNCWITRSVEPNSVVHYQKK